MIEQRPDLSVAARETLSKQPKATLTEEFAKRVNVLACSMQDSQELATLFAPWDWQVRYIAEKEGRQYLAPSKEWVDFMESLGSFELAAFKRVIRAGYRIYDLRTLGDFRDFTAEKVSVAWGVSARGRAFATLAFRKQEAESLTLGLQFSE